ncbi:MAG: hypothetical protein ACFE9L_10180 [Candidatus Hodarchaeota archaeon]
MIGAPKALPPQSDLKKILISLNKKNLINNNIFNRALEDLMNISEKDQNYLVPLIDMYGLQSANEELLHLDQSLISIEAKMNEVAQAWETGTYSKTETKTILSKLVLQKNRTNNLRKNLQLRRKAIISRLKRLNNIADFNLEEFISLLLQNNEEEKMGEITSKFKESWEKYSKDREDEVEIKHVSQKLDELESDILSSLMTPITEEDRVVFNLDDIISPIDQKKESYPSLLKTKVDKDIKAEEDQIKPTISIQTQQSFSIWDVVGKVVFNHNNNPIGLLRSPIVVKGTVFLPVVTEKPLSISILKEKYREILKQVDLDLKVTTTQEIKTIIANSLGVPTNFALQPSIFNQWLGNIGDERIIPAKPQLSKVYFIETTTIEDLSSDHLVVKNEDLKQISVPAWIPVRGEAVIDSVQVNEEIIGMAGSSFGSINGIMYDTPFGQSFVIKREVPPSYILTLFLEGLGIQNFSELRFTIAKKLNIGEGESFSAENLWSINNQERLLISPHEIATSYYSVLPSSAFTYTNKLRAKIGVYFHSVPETFRYLIGKSIIKKNEEKGMIYGYSVSNGNFYILWAPKSSIDIIKELGRKSSERYVNRFKRRMSLALGVSYKESSWPSNLARYFLNFIWMTEDHSLIEAMSVIEERFSLDKVIFSDVLEISEDNLKCKN